MILPFQYLLYWNLNLKSVQSAVQSVKSVSERSELTYFLVTAFVILPERIQAVQTIVLLTLPPTSILTRFTFGLNVRFVAL